MDISAHLNIKLAKTQIPWLKTMIFISKQLTWRLMISFLPKDNKVSYTAFIKKHYLLVLPDSNSLFLISQWWILPHNSHVVVINIYGILHLHGVVAEEGDWLALPYLGARSIVCHGVWGQQKLLLEQSMNSEVIFYIHYYFSGSHDSYDEYKMSVSHYT